MKKKIIKMKYIIGIMILFTIIVGVTYALYVKLLYTANVAGTTQNLTNYVIYSEGTSINSGSLVPTNTYTNGANATITFYQSSTCPYNLYGYINLYINSIDSSLTESEVLRYTVVNNRTSTIVGEGSFYNKYDNVLAAYNIPLSTQETTYTVYIWLDIEKYDSEIANDDFDITISCRASVKEDAGNAATYITNLYLDNKDATTVTNNSIEYQAASSKGLMNDRLGGTTQSLDGGNIRYYGAAPNNYVWLGDYFTENYMQDYSGSTVVHSAGEKKLWRIVGVFDGKLKLTPADRVLTIQKGLVWDTSSGVNNNRGINQWGPSTYSNTGAAYEGADIMRLLNPGYEEESVNNSLYWNKGTGTVYTGAGNATTANVSFANTGLSLTERNVIDTNTWYLGSYTQGNYSYADYYYARERQSSVLGKNCPAGPANCNDKVVRTATWNGKVGLLYFSDYLYATDFTICNQPFANFQGSGTCYNNNWFRNMYSLVLMTPIRLNNIGYNVFQINPQTGSVQTANTSSSFYASYSNTRLFPTFYLKPDVVITRGSGTETDPYVITSR